MGRVNQTKIKGGCQSERGVVPHYSNSDLPLGIYIPTTYVYILSYCASVLSDPSLCYIMFLVCMLRTACVVRVRSHPNACPPFFYQCKASEITLRNTNDYASAIFELVEK